MYIKVGSYSVCHNCIAYTRYLCSKMALGTLQMFTGNYRVFAGKSECWDFKFMEIAGNLILQGYYGDSLH